ncbi:MAG: tetratricopeptide repeat protein, partial [bacterium]
FSTPGTDWQRAPRNQEIAYQADMLLGSPTYGNPTSGVLKITVSPSFTSNFDELYGALVEAFKNDYDQFKFISQSETTVSGLRASVLEHEGKLKGEQDTVRSIAYVFLVGDTLFQIMAFFGPDDSVAQKEKLQYIARSFQVDPNLSVDWGGAKPGSDEVGPIIDADVAAVLYSAVPWAIGGAVIFGIIALLAIGGGAGRNFFLKFIFFILMLTAGACGGAGLKWGMIAGATGGGHQVVDWLVQAVMLPFTWMLTFMASMMGAGSAVGVIKAIMQIQTAFNRVVIGFCSAAISGIPYGVYILITRKTYINAVGYILLVIVGFFPALIGLGLLTYTGASAEDFEGKRKLSQVRDSKDNPQKESPKTQQQGSSNKKPVQVEIPPLNKPAPPIPDPVQPESESGLETSPPIEEPENTEPTVPEEITEEPERQAATEPESSNEIDELNKRIEADPSDADAYNARGLAFLKINNYSQTIADCTMAIGLNPKLADAYNNRGLAYFAKDDADRAITDFNRGIELNPDFEDAYFNRGSAHVIVNNYDAAISDFTNAIRLNPNHANYYYQRGQTYSAKGDRERATKDLEKAFELDPSLRRRRR